MQKVMVNLPAQPERDYAIWVKHGVLDRIDELYDFHAYSKVFVVADQAIRPILNKVMQKLPDGTASIILPVSEDHKNIETVQKIWTAMHDTGCDRKSLVINLGGGVIGDIGGFAASTYMRGMDFLNIPTTLLAQVDASVGGKTGFNFNGIKNLVGIFNQPIGVVIDTGVLSSLPEREFVSGFGEVIKHGLIWDERHFKQATAKPPLEFTPDELVSIITRSCQIKTELVQTDETEGNKRKVLNFGHTVGHAVEVLSLDTEEPLLHGEAVSIGIRAEAIISQRLGLLSVPDLKRVERALAKSGLPVTIPAGAETAAILEKMRSDKKNEAGQVNFTLLESIGRAVYNQQAEAAVITEALEAARKNP